ncbi:MAG: hypothetical protein ACTSR2_01180 [Candidatus Hodarchaeales archaeon]
MVKLQINITFKNQQQRNKVLGTAFEKHILYIIRKYYNNNVKSGSIHEFIDKKMLKRYIIFTSYGYFVPYFVLNPRKHLHDIFDENFKPKFKKSEWLFEKIRNISGGGLHIVRLSKIIRKADIIIETSNGPIVYDAKYRTTSKVGVKDVIRIYCYKKLMNSNRIGFVTSRKYVLTKRAYKMAKSLNIEIISVDELEARLGIEGTIVINKYDNGYEVKAIFDDEIVLLHKGSFTQSQ